MKVIELPAWMSYSQVSSYLRCGEAYRLERLLKAPSRPTWALVGGSAVHTASERWDQALLEGTVLDDHGTLWAEEFEKHTVQTEEQSGFARTEFRATGRASKQWPLKEDSSFWGQQGPVFVRNWATWRLASPWEVWHTPEGLPAIEIEFMVEIGGVMVRGAIDRVMEDPHTGAVMPVDLKSGREPDDTLQLGTYAKAMDVLLGVRPVYGTYWMARTGGTSAMHNLTRFTDPFLDHMYGKARTGMEAGVFLPKVSNMCSGCGVKDSCFAVDGPNAAEFSPLSVPNARMGE